MGFPTGCHAAEQVPPYLPHRRDRWHAETCRDMQGDTQFAACVACPPINKGMSCIPMALCIFFYLPEATLDLPGLDRLQNTNTATNVKVLDLRKRALAGVAQWIEHRPANQRVAGPIPSQGTCLGCGPGSQLGALEGKPHIDVSLPLFLLPFPSL